MIITSEADIAKVENLSDRRELRNFARFLRLWPIHGFDMLERPRWQKYLAISQSEAMALQRNPAFLVAPSGPNWCYVCGGARCDCNC